MFSTNSTPTSVLCPTAGKSRSVSSNKSRQTNIEAYSLETSLQRLFINYDSSQNKDDKATKADISPLSTRSNAKISSSSPSNNVKSSSVTEKRTPKLVLPARRKLFVNDENNDAAAATSSSSVKIDVDAEKKGSAKKVKVDSNGAKSSAGSVSKRSKSKSMSSSTATSTTNWETVRVSATPLSINGGNVMVGKKISVEQLFAEESAVNTLMTKKYAGRMCAVQSAPTMAPLSPVLQSLFGGGISVLEGRSVLDCVNRLTPSGARNSSMRHHLRRQQSASATFGGRGPITVPSPSCRIVPHGSMPGSAVNFTRRFTPPPGREVSSPIYAASKLYESPSVRQLPMPPLDWVAEVKENMLLRLQRSIIDEEDQDGALDDAITATTTKFFLPNLVEDAISASSSSSDEEEKHSLSSSTDAGVVFDMDASADASPSATASAKLLSMLKQNAPTTDDKVSDDCNSSSGCGASVSSASSIDDEPLPPLTATATTFVRVDPLALIAAVSAM